MKYFGGKYRLRKEISSVINSILNENQTFVDMFVGGGSIISSVDGNRKRIGNDISLPLISMWNALLEGWKPPEIISQDEYKQAKCLDDKNPIKAFIGYGCSFAVKYFGGYARAGIGKKQRNYAFESKKLLLEKVRMLKGDVEFTNKDYIEFDIPKNSLIYCDIPYKNTTGYTFGSFDHDQFEDWARNNKGVIVSEYYENLPKGAIIIWRKTSKKSVRNSKGECVPTREIIYTFDSDIASKVLNIWGE